MKRFFVAGAVSALLLAPPVSAETVRGTGSAPVTQDLEAVRNGAEQAARQALVVSMLKAAIGAQRLREIPAATIQSIASQIRDDMIVSRSSRREGAIFYVDLDADIDGAWFRTQIDNEGIASSSDRTSSGQLIFVMLDETQGAAANYAEPAETTVEFDHRTGGSYSDHSADATSQRDLSASSSKSAAGYSGSAAAAAGASDSYGSAAARSKAKASGAFVAKSSNADIHKYDHASKTRINAEVHDDVRYREHVVYQRPPSNSDAGYIMRALDSTLIKYGIGTADPYEALASFFAGKPPRLDALQASARFRPFLSTLARTRNAPFFMGGSLAVEHGRPDAATGFATCSGQLSANAYATADGRNIAASAVTASATGATPGACQGKLASLLARAASDDIGPQVQNYWRKHSAVEATNTLERADYSLTLRAKRLDMAMQADILDALQSTPGVESQSFVSQGGNEMRFVVRYSGKLPLQLALYQKLRSHPGFSAMQSTAQGRSVLLCLTACPATP